MSLQHILVLIVCLIALAFVATSPVWRKRSSARALNGYQPREDRVLVKRSERPEPGPDEVVMPASQQKQKNEGTVVAIGPGAINAVTGRREPIDLAVGDVVEFLDYSGFEVEIDGEIYLSMRDLEIHGRRL